MSHLEKYRHEIIVAVKTGNGCNVATEKAVVLPGYRFTETLCEEGAGWIEYRRYDVVRKSDGVTVDTFVLDGEVQNRDLCLRSGHPRRGWTVISK